VNEEALAHRGAIAPKTNKTYIYSDVTRIIIGLIEIRKGLGSAFIWFKKENGGRRFLFSVGIYVQAYTMPHARIYCLDSHPSKEA
jgi:hypothetical protein